ncbi:SNF2 family N-terminal domain-containing protein [Irpex rosettiformis]|uniref:SNF2 family N-terminal domain-containing protein n=1 Tax=Irpex rosettiformis TaxID=378272 RepID=A0ACB8UHA1_9APHY|nr:SNF2 family N-terminal domain-containing protein [Irpex rosettiformis]
MSFNSSAEANRKAALDKLKFKKASKQPTPTSGPSTTSSTYSWHGQQQSSSAPPAQSRDATIPSRYFPSTPVPAGRVLVPSSSPVAADASYRDHQPLFDHDAGDSIPGLHHADPWKPTVPVTTIDTLSAPSGFITAPRPSDASFSRPWMTNGINAGMPLVSQNRELREDSEPPRKRQNCGNSSADPSELPNVPDSPEIQRMGQRRRMATNTWMSSDESLSEIDKNSTGAGPSRPRIVRGQPSDPPTPVPPTPSSVSTEPNTDSETQFKRFRIINQFSHDDAKLRHAWLQAKEDERKATELLQDPNFRVPAPVSVARPKPPRPSVETGRVKEVEEASKAERARVKEMGKKSAIYANFALKTSTPPPSKINGDRPIPPTTPATPATPASPEVIRPRAKRLKRKIVDSDSEAELSGSEDEKRISKRESTSEEDTLSYFNSAPAEALQELTGCSLDQGRKIVELRPFSDVNDLNTRLNQGRKKAGPMGISPRIFEDSIAVFKGYGAVDRIVSKCEDIGEALKQEIAKWTASSDSKGKAKEGSSSPLGTPDMEDGALKFTSRNDLSSDLPDYYIRSQPAALSSDVQLKEYQMVGINWLNLLFTKGHNCILADEMGLGKTVQVISFFSHLKSRGSKGPHLIVVPSSTLENWIREFKRFAPSISVVAYYAGKEERPRIRQRLLDTQGDRHDGWEVLVTTYNLAQGDDKDRKFFRKINWETCVYDEGHVLKNFQSQRYQSLIRVGARWRLLLTGTPLQNNLQELMSLMNFIMPDEFSDISEQLRAVFKTKGDSKITLLAQQRVSRAKKMMTPFVLRRRKDQVLQDLPKKLERIEWCEMTAMQKSIYNDALRRSRKTIFDLTEEPAELLPPPKGKGKPTKKTKGNARQKDKMFLENSTNVLMDLRKAASHPMLFRRLYTDDALTSIARLLLKEPEYKKRGAIFEYVKEDMEVMTDSELQVFCGTYKSTRRYLQKEECYLQAGKVKVLLQLLRGYREQGRRVLIFSQFTQILDILQRVLEREKIKFVVLTGSTPVDVRQSLVDEFTEDESIKVFLLSTKAGGMGINLTAASVVIMFDQDFNPHNDKQAQDRAYRIGQKRDVDVVKLITKGSIEEDILELGKMKLALDEAVAGEEGEERIEQEMKTTLMNVVRKKLEVDENPEDPELKCPVENAVEQKVEEHEEDVMDVDED